jgi:hypothetical protein
MKEDFKKDVSASLQRLYRTLLRKAKRRRLSEKHFAMAMNYLNFLQMVASNSGAYCHPTYFDSNLNKLGFDVATEFNLLTLDESAAQCVYDIMVCRRDYILCGDKKLQRMKKFDSCKYKTQQEAVEAMRLFKRDSIQMTGGMIPYYVRNWFNKNR